MKASYKIIWKNSAKKELKLLPKKQIVAVLEKVKKLSGNSFPHGAIKLTSSEDIFQLRIGTYRVVYSVSKKILTVEIIKVKHRRKVYR